MIKPNTSRKHILRTHAERCLPLVVRWLRFCFPAVLHMCFTALKCISSRDPIPMWLVLFYALQISVLLKKQEV